MRKKWFIFLLAFVMCTGQTLIFAESNDSGEEKVTGKVEEMKQTDLENETKLDPPKAKEEKIGGGG